MGRGELYGVCTASVGVYLVVQVLLYRGLTAPPTSGDDEGVVRYVVDGATVLFQGHIRTTDAVRATCVHPRPAGDERVPTELRIDGALWRQRALYQTLPFTALCRFAHAVDAPRLAIGDRAALRAVRARPRPTRRVCVCSTLHGGRSVLHRRRGALQAWMRMWASHDAHVVLYLLGRQRRVPGLERAVHQIVNLTSARYHTRDSHDEVESEYQRANEDCLLRSVGACEWLLNMDVDEHLVAYAGLDALLARHADRASVGFAASGTDGLWRRAFRPTIHTRVDAHGSTDRDVVLVDREAAYVVHTGVAHGVARTAAPAVLTAPPVRLGPPSAYRTPHAQGYEALLLYETLQRRYARAARGPLSALFVFNHAGERVGCDHVANATRRFARRLSDASLVLPSWSSCPGRVLLSIDQPDRPPGTLSVPFASHVRWTPGEPVPWSHATPRTVRISFVGSLDMASATSRRIHRAVHRACRASSVCEPFVLEKGVLQNDEWAITRALELKRRSVFCLEPQGDNIGRRSVLDSLLTGCIPVFVDDDPDEWRGLYSHFVNMSRLGLSVRVDALEDMERLLAHVDVLSLQRHIRRDAVRLSYTLSDRPVGDAGDVFASLLTDRTWR